MDVKLGYRNQWVCQWQLYSLSNYNVTFFCFYYRITPVPSEERTDTRLYQIFFVWFAVNANILTYVPPESIFHGITNIH